VPLIDGLRPFSELDTSSIWMLHRHVDFERSRPRAVPFPAYTKRVQCRFAIDQVVTLLEHHLPESLPNFTHT